MKKSILTFFSVILIFVIAKIIFFNNNAEVSYSIEKNLVDIGKVKKIDRSLATFVITNTGHADLEIENVVVDCHCTAPIWSKEPIKSGEKFELLVEYDNHSLGFFEQTITVQFKFDKNPPPLLIMQGIII